MCMGHRSCERHDTQCIEQSSVRNMPDLNMASIAVRHVRTPFDKNDTWHFHQCYDSANRGCLNFLSSCRLTVSMSNTVSASTSKPRLNFWHLQRLRVGHEASKDGRIWFFAEMVKWKKSFPMNFNHIFQYGRSRSNAKQSDMSPGRPHREYTTVTWMNAMDRLRKVS